jgi:hypothetical protein
VNGWVVSKAVSKSTSQRNAKDDEEVKQTVEMIARWVEALQSFEEM